MTGRVIFCNLHSKNTGDCDIDADKIADSTAITMLAEIQKIIKNDEYTDFDAIEEIVCLFEKYDISASPRHDF